MVRPNRVPVAKAGYKIHGSALLVLLVSIIYHFCSEELMKKNMNTVY